MATIIYQHNRKTGAVYAYRSESYWDKGKKQPRSRRIFLGKLDPQSGAIIPTNSVACGTPRRRGPRPSVACTCRFYGASYLFDAIGEQTGITANLTTCFPETWRQLQSVVYYLVLEHAGSMSRFSKWASLHTHPYGVDIPSQRLSELFASITEDAQQRFFQERGSRVQGREYLFYDTTSISSYSETLRQVRYGYNREHDLLPQINLALLFSQTSMQPVWYRKLAGNISDVSTVTQLLSELDYLNIGKLTLVMDKGFYSERNIDALYQQHLKFLIGARLSLRLVQGYLERVRDSIAHREHYRSKYGLYAESFSAEWAYTEVKKRSENVLHEKRRLYIHLYYDDARAAEDRIAFNTMLDRLEYELSCGERNPEHEALYKTYYTVHQTPVRGRSISPKQDAIREAEQDYGFFVLLSNGIKDPLEALVCYRAKDMIEKAFGSLKERLNMRRQFVASEESLSGKLFVQFVALMYLSHIQKVMLEHDLYKEYTLQGLLDTLDVIQRFEYPGKKPVCGEITSSQAKLFQTFGVKVPS